MWECQVDLGNLGSLATPPASRGSVWLLDRFHPVDESLDATLWFDILVVARNMWRRLASTIGFRCRIDRYLRVQFTVFTCLANNLQLTTKAIF